MNVIIEILNKKNKKKDSNTRNMNKITVHNDFITDYLNSDTIV